MASSFYPRTFEDFFSTGLNVLWLYKEREFSDSLTFLENSQQTYEEHDETRFTCSESMIFACHRHE